MATRTTPSPTSGRTIPAPAAGGGGGGATNPWQEWTELPLDPSDGWTVIKQGQADNTDVTVGLDGDELKVKFETARNYQISATGSNGVMLVRSAHIDWWSEAGIDQPSGQGANIFQPEAVQLKVEVLFNTDDGPIHGGGHASSHAYGMMCVVGFASYSSDQSGSPAGISASMDWGGAGVKKHLGGAPSGSNSTNMFRSGHMTRYSSTLNTFGTLWKGQNTAGSGANDSITFASAPLRNEAATGTWSRCTAQGMAFSSTTPFSRGWGEFAWRDNFTRWSNDRFLHIALYFGNSLSQTQAAQIKIKRIRVLIQPLENREPLKS